MLSSIESHSASRDANLDLVLGALSDRTRRELLARLADGAAMVTELAKPFDMSLPAVSKHLKVLEKAGLVDRTIDGRVHRCSLNALPLMSVRKWLEHYEAFWGETLDALSEYVQRDRGSDANA